MSDKPGTGPGQSASLGQDCGATRCFTLTRAGLITHIVRGNYGTSVTEEKNRLYEVIVGKSKCTAGVISYAS